jgi:heme exporter protein D
MPDLGNYAFAVLASYGATILLVAGVIALTIRQRRRVARDLARVEARMTQGDA